MGLDLLVLPLTRFLAGQYQGPVEAVAERVGTPKPDNPEDVARERVRRIREELERRVAGPLPWVEEGDVALSVQYHYGALQALRDSASPAIGERSERERLLHRRATRWEPSSTDGPSCTTRRA